MNKIVLILVAITLTGCSMKTEKNAEKAKPKEDQIIYLQGIAALKNNDPQTAVRMFETVIKLNPQNESAHLLSGKIYLEAKKPQEALRVLALAADQFPNNGEIPYLLAVAFKQSGYPKQAFLAAKRSYEVYEAWQKKEEMKRSQMLMAVLIQEIRSSQDAEEQTQQ